MGYPFSDVVDDPYSDVLKTKTTSYSHDNRQLYRLLLLRNYYIT